MANLCILADSKVLPDGWVLYDYFGEELKTLLSLVGTETTTASTDSPSSATLMTPAPQNASPNRQPVPAGPSKGVNT